MKGKFLLLKTPWTSETRPRGHWAGVDPSALSLRTGFSGTRRWYAGFQGDSSNSLIQLCCLWISSATSMAQPYRYSSGTYTLAVSYGSLVDLKTHSTRGKPCFWYLPWYQKFAYLEFLSLVCVVSHGSRTDYRNAEHNKRELLVSGRQPHRHGV